MEHPVSIENLASQVEYLCSKMEDRRSTEASILARLAALESAAARNGGHQPTRSRPSGVVAKIRPVEGPACPECDGVRWWPKKADANPKAPAWRCATKNGDEYCAGRLWTQEAWDEAVQMAEGTF